MNATLLVTLGSLAVERPPLRRPSEPTGLEIGRRD
jgi:hypothetical protein